MPPPTRDTLRNDLARLLDGADLESVSVKALRRQLEAKHGCSLKDKKDDIKAWCLEMTTNTPTDTTNTDFFLDAWLAERKQRETASTHHLLDAAAAEGDISTIKRAIMDLPTATTVAATPRRNWDQELARVMAELPRGTPVAVRFAHIRHLEWSVDAVTMPHGFCAWLRDCRKALAPYFTAAARALRKHLELAAAAAARGGDPFVPTSTIHRLFVLDSQTPDAQRHNEHIKLALRAFATFRKIRRHPLEFHAARLWWEAPDTRTKKAAIHAMAGHAWEHRHVRAAPKSALRAAAAALRRAAKADPKVAKGAAKLLTRWQDAAAADPADTDRARAIRTGDGPKKSILSQGVWRFNPQAEDPVALDDETFRTPAALTVPQMDIRIGQDAWSPLLARMEDAAAAASARKRKDAHGSRHGPKRRRRR